MKPSESQPVRRTPPVVSIVGRSGAGKTTLLVKIVGELKRRGYRVAAVKHALHGFEIDQPGKDSQRLQEAGADTVVLASADRLAMIKAAKAPGIDDVAAYCTDVDLIITEGFKHADTPKIEVVRAAHAHEPLCRPENGLIALAADGPLMHMQPVPVFGRDDLGGLADFIEHRFLAHRGRRRPANN